MRAGRYRVLEMQSRARPPPQKRECRCRFDEVIVEEKKRKEKERRKKFTVPPIHTLTLNKINEGGKKVCASERCNRLSNLRPSGREPAEKKIQSLSTIFFPFPLLFSSSLLLLLLFGQRSVRACLAAGRPWRTDCRPIVERERERLDGRTDRADAFSDALDAATTAAAAASFRFHVGKSFGLGEKERLENIT